MCTLRNLSKHERFFFDFFWVEKAKTFPNNVSRIGFSAWFAFFFNQHQHRLFQDEVGISSRDTSSTHMKDYYSWLNERAQPPAKKAQ